MGVTSDTMITVSLSSLGVASSGLYIVVTVAQIRRFGWRKVVESDIERFEDDVDGRTRSPLDDA